MVVDSSRNRDSLNPQLYRHNQVVHFGDQQVFANATTYTTLLFLEKAGSDQFHVVKAGDLMAWRMEGKASEGVLSASKATVSAWNFMTGAGSSLYERLSEAPTKLGDVTDIFVGLQTSADDVFIMDVVSEEADTLTLKSKSLDENCVLEKGLFFPLVSGTDVNRYAALPERQYILFPYSVQEGDVRLIDFASISTRYPRTAAYLSRNKERLEGREKGKMLGAGWYGYIYLKNMRRQHHVKLCVPRLVDRLYAAYDAEGIHFLGFVA